MESINYFYTSLIANKTISRLELIFVAWLRNQPNTSTLKDQLAITIDLKEFANIDIRREVLNRMLKNLEDLGYIERIKVPGERAKLIRLEEVHNA